MICKSAKEYISKLNWKIVPIPPGTKGPNQKGWNKPENLIVTSEGCDNIRKGWNIGAQLEESGIVVLDIDNIEYTKLIFEYFGLDYDTIFAGAPRIVGRPGHDKAIFRAPEGVKLGAHKLSWPTQTEDNDRITVIEFRAGAIQDVLPPSIHPDTQVPYEWRISPFDVDLPELPKPILSIWLDWDQYHPRMQNLCPWDQTEHKKITKKARKVKKQDDGVIQQYNDKHSVGELLSYYGYIQKGRNRWLSPFSSTGLAGVITFDDGRAFSHHASDPWSCEHSIDAFDLFCQMQHGGNLNAALDAARLEFNIPTNAELEEHGKSIAETILNRKKEERKKKVLPKSILEIPGILQEVVDYYNATAKKPQPQFAVSAALTLGSVVMGRRFITDQDNYSSIYIANLGKTSSGKEHPITVIEAVLDKAGIAENLMGPPGYHSSGAIFSALMNSPCHLAIIDELGLHFQSTNLSGNSNKLDAQRVLMEAFGRLGGSLRPMAYSTMTLTDSQKAKLEQSTIQHPAITILGMSTQDTVYDNISLDSISSGFIPRFVFVESVNGRQKSRRIGNKPEFSPELIQWTKDCYKAHTDTGNVSEDFGAMSPPEPVLIPFEPGALDLLDDFEERLIKRQNELDKHKISGLLGKTAEIAYRIALIVAVSCNHSCIYDEDAQWAIDFVEYYSVQTEINMKKRVYGSEFEAACKEVSEHIIDSGARGATEYEIRRACHKYRALEPVKRNAVMEVVPGDYDIEFVNISAGPGGGRPRQAYISRQI